MAGSTLDDVTTLAVIGAIGVAGYLIYKEFFATGAPGPGQNPVGGNAFQTSPLNAQGTGTVGTPGQQTGTNLSSGAWNVPGVTGNGGTGQFGGGAPALGTPQFTYPGTPSTNFNAQGPGLQRYRNNGRAGRSRR